MNMNMNNNNNGNNMINNGMNVYQQICQFLTYY